MAHIANNGQLYNVEIIESSINKRFLNGPEYEISEMAKNVKFLECSIMWKLLIGS